MPTKKPKPLFASGFEARDYRLKQGLNQTAFWGRVAITQSGGSRYETGRDLPPPVELLLHFAYAPEKQAQAMLAFLRAEDQ